MSPKPLLRLSSFAVVGNKAVPSQMMGMSDDRGPTPQELLRDLARDASLLSYGDEPDRYRVVSRAEMLLRRVFGPEHQYVDALSNIKFYYAYDGTTERRQERWHQAASALTSLLTTATDELDL